MSVVRIGLLVAAVMIPASVAWGQSVTAPLLPGQSRDELKRRWDLNSDGEIDEAEAEMARTKMRRERMDLLQRGQRGDAKASTVAPPEPNEAESTLLFPETPVIEPSRAKQSFKSDKATDAKKKPSWSAAREPAPPPKKDLNAGRLPAGLPAARGLPPGTPPPGRINGGLVPSVPSMSGSPSSRTVQPPRPPATRATRPTPTFPSRPRVSAEEIGGP